MKKSLFLTMVAAALMGGQAFADDVPTKITGAEREFGSVYYGKFDEATGGSVTITGDNGGVSNNAQVYGAALFEGEAVYGNSVTMKGGKVSYIYGGCGFEGNNAYGNTVNVTGGEAEVIHGGEAAYGMKAYENRVEMSGGKVGDVYGGNTAEGEAYGNTVVMSGGEASAIEAGSAAKAHDNVAIVTGGSITSYISAGYADSWEGETRAYNNSLHFVGKGAKNVAIADGQGNTASYSGSDAGISVAKVWTGYGSLDSADANAVNIYGTGVTVSGTIQGTQILTFNITNDQMVGQTKNDAMLNLTSQYSWEGLDLSNKELQIKDIDVQSWAPGSSITLVQSVQAIQGLEDGKVVDIMRGDIVTATATLKLAEDNKSLLLTNIQGKNVPEPTTGTLGLLALAGLCARRRRK